MTQNISAPCDILFRGRRVDNNEYVEGSVVISPVDGDLQGTKRQAYINSYCMDETGKVFREVYEVKPETVGQYILIDDKNGKKIFGNDIVRTKYGRLGRVVWHKYSACWDLAPIETPENIEFPAPDQLGLWNSHNLEVVQQEDLSDICWERRLEFLKQHKFKV